MAEPDCEVCRVMGYRSCDVCGGWVHPRGLGMIPGRELCGWCLRDQLEAEKWLHR